MEHRTERQHSPDRSRHRLGTPDRLRAYPVGVGDAGGNDSDRVKYWTPPEWLIPWISRAHVAVYRLSRGRIGGRVDGMPCILLRTIGRRSGKPHTVCLSYLPDGDSMVVVGSFGGADHHPAWYHNVVANPEVIVQNRERVFTATAETLTGIEREAVWEARIAGAPRYAHYQERTDREIPVVRLS